MSILLVAVIMEKKLNFAEMNIQQLFAYYLKTGQLPNFGFKDVSIRKIKTDSCGGGIYAILDFVNINYQCRTYYYHFDDNTLVDPEDGPHYMHMQTGAVDVREEWIEAYSEEELERRGLTAEQAFQEDDGETLIEVIKDENGDWVQKNSN